jgi:uncharacterized protein YqeY
MNSGVVIPRITFELDMMKQKVVAAMVPHSEEMEAMISEYVEQALSEQNFKAAVQNAVQKTVTSAVKDFFEYGKGRTAIYESVSEGLSFDWGKEEE